MTQYISKSALAAEIERLHQEHSSKYERDEAALVLEDLEDFIDTLEVKEVDEKFECPTIKVKDDVSVSSRVQYIDDELKPIAEFIMEYASWNLHKEEWNQPVLEVPLFRVLDALIQRGKPYCEG